MFSFLKNHPFAVEAFFESSIVLTFATPKEELSPLIPECFELDTFDNRAFIAVAMVQTKQLRPKGCPKILGHDFLLVGYRVFVRFTNQNGKRLRGLYILRSETDKIKMKFFGNIFTHYNYATTDIGMSTENGITVINSKQSGFIIQIDISHTENVALPPSSPFASWKEARRFAGPLPFTFTYDAAEKKVLIIEGVRENWTPTPINIIRYKIPFIDNLNLRTVELANGFSVHDVPYYWKKGRTELWKKEETFKVS